MKQFVKNIIGQNNITYVKSFFPSKKEKEYKQKHKQFYSQLLKKGDIYYDVGANLGLKIEPIIEEGIKIVAVEPQKECVDYLKKKYGNKINIVSKGLGAKEDVQTMYMTSASTISSFSKDWINSTKESGRFSEFDWNEEREIEITTLDKLIEQYGHPNYIKIDVEGFEYEVLRGLSKPVNYISFEYTVPEQLESVQNCISRIAEISNNQIKCNYYPGDSLVLALDEWLGLEDMLEKINAKEFIDSSMGDIYVKYTGE